jgi:hypothetical protein
LLFNVSAEKLLLPYVLRQQLKFLTILFSLETIAACAAEDNFLFFFKKYRFIGNFSESKLYYAAGTFQTGV